MFFPRDTQAGAVHNTVYSRGILRLLYVIFISIVTITTTISTN